ncbi:MAG: hypothetical protein Tsb0032_20640 [Kiloniellaceae bacterium]
MSHLRLAASALATALLLVLCAILAEPAFELTAVNRRGGIGAGGLPQLVVIAVAVLAPLSFLQDVLRFRRSGHITGGFDAADGDAAEARRTALLGSTVLVLLAAYAFAWRLTGFLPASIAFMSVLCLILLPAPARSLKRSLLSVAFSAAFCVGVWALFVHLLGVPLR